MKTYGSTEIQKGLGITKSQAIHWTQIGAVIPHQDSQGRGGRRRYSLQNVIEFALCRELSLFGIPTYVMVNALEYLRAPIFGPEATTPTHHAKRSDVPTPVKDVYLEIAANQKNRITFWEYLEGHKEGRETLLLIEPIEPPMPISGFTFMVLRDASRMPINIKGTRLIIPIGLIASKLKTALG